jgi:hypothetical protein
VETLNQDDPALSGKTSTWEEPPASGTEKDVAKAELTNAKKEVEELGGWEGFRNGEWLFRLIQKAFKSYYENANVEYFQEKYPGLSEDQIADKLIAVSARHAGLYGVATGALVSTDEIVAILTGFEGGVGLPVNIAVAAIAMCAEAVSLVRLHLQLIANLAKLTDYPLDPDDPEDILIILAYAIGGAAAEAAGKIGMKIGQATTKRVVRKFIKKEVLEALQALARKIGIKLLQRSIIKYTVPLVSMLIGSSWNYVATIAVGKRAKQHFRKRAEDLGNQSSVKA